MNRKISSLTLAVIALAAIWANQAAANLLGNPGFEDPPFAGAEDPGAGSAWTPFGANFRVQQAAPGPCDPITCAGAFEGTVSLKNFGEAGVFQDFAASPGDPFEGSVWAVNPENADVLVLGQVAAVNIEWRDAAGVLDVAFGDTIDASTPVDTWTELLVSGTAPAGTTTARFVLVTGPFDPAGPGGGAPRWDAASFDLVPEPGSLGLIGLGLFGLLGIRRRR